MRVKSVSVEKSGIEFCFNNVSVIVRRVQNEIRIAEEITYEVTTNSVLSNLQVVLRDGKAFLVSPFGENLIDDPRNIVKGLLEILEKVRDKKEVYDKFMDILKDFKVE
ncbi:hypothetical protein GWK48_07525 [Metallosphaera tengchongensis]|uniref:Uncharacterized protein n=1 Tax=Metallosphaera tengchongensis TaxID=1532350 RepID=A0A6N0NTQ0_9CREN|nr:hypothetical protein [Metallosphaera tengchongensis]QKR00244.1 hypothetical protein GWK48_07525 [Metallosphaera tengchongensis]